ncbi:LppX_LprAFG lipoprotein [Streptomyces klenkii]|uniref:LppX_LprAFG lipoprotein n=1 Tax=Streptomyces klenkii TaxID=1420899 RepID=UPI00339F83F9
MRSRRPIAFASTTAAALVLCAGCSGAGEPSADHEAAVRAAVDATGRSTARIDEKIEMGDGGSQKYTISITGDFDMAGDKGRLTAALDASPMHLEEIFANGNVYLKGMDPEAPETWGFVARDKVEARYLLRAPANDPEHVLRQIAAMRKVKKEGEEKVNGAHTVHYSGTLDFDTATLRMDAEMRTKAGQVRDMSGGELPIRAEAWIDDQGRVARTRISHRVGQAGSTATMTLSDQGKPVDTKAPADSAPAVIERSGPLMG